MFQKSKKYILGVFSAFLIIALNSQAQTFATLRSFSKNDDGASPNAGFILNGQTLYGATQYGTNGSGTLFAIQTDGSGFELLHTFAPHTGFINNFYNADGVFPNGNMILASNVLYGMTQSGGTNGNGTIFSVKIDGNDFTNLFVFSGGVDGGTPFEGLAISGNSLYGATVDGGTNGYGTVFSINTDGSNFRNLHSFPPYHYNGSNFFTNSEGSNPAGGLVLVDGTLYGTTTGAGTNGCGVIFSMNTNGTQFTVLHHFAFNEGFNPRAVLLHLNDTLYGTTSGGGVNSNGAVFSIKTNGTSFGTLFNFSRATNGSTPIARPMVNGANLIGTTKIGGKNDCGTIYMVQANGLGFTNLYNFTGSIDGANPVGGVVSFGNMVYGSASAGGTNGYGTIFSLALPIPPNLAILRSGSNVILTWPTNIIGYNLQSALDLQPPVTWNPVSPPPVVVNGQNTVTNPLAATQQFYRLSQ